MQWGLFAPAATIKCVETMWGVSQTAGEMALKWWLWIPMLLNLFNQKAFSPQNFTSPTHKIFCSLERKSSRKKKTHNRRKIYIYKKKDEARNWNRKTELFFLQIIFLNYIRLITSESTPLIYVTKNSFDYFLLTYNVHIEGAYLDKATADPSSLSMKQRCVQYWIPTINPRPGVHSQVYLRASCPTFAQQKRANICLKQCKEQQRKGTVPPCIPKPMRTNLWKPK